MTSKRKKEVDTELSDAERTQNEDIERANSIKEKNKPLVHNIYTADPSAHVFEGKIYIYPSHDIETDAETNDNGDQFAMRDYHVLSMDHPQSETIDHGVALAIEDIPWAKKQLWAPDAAYKNGKYYLYFPARDHNDIFRIGVAISNSPSGPFIAEDNYIEGTYSIDPAVYESKDGTHYLYWGGIWGGQLQNWRTGKFIAEDTYPPEDKPADLPRVAKLSEDMKSIVEEPKQVSIHDENGNLLTVGDNDRRYFEAPWMHEFKGKYYFSYSTGDTHKIAYATGDSPYGPFTYQGVILNPVLGWTNHHSIVEYEGKWYLFYHDSSLSKGQTHLRCVKMCELTHKSDGTIETISAYY